MNLDLTLFANGQIEMIYQFSNIKVLLKLLKEDDRIWNLIRKDVLKEEAIKKSQKK